MIISLSVGPLGRGATSFHLSPSSAILCHPLHYRLFATALSMSLLTHSLDRYRSCERIIRKINDIAYVL